MTKAVTSAEEVLRTFSNDRTELLKRLLEDKARQARKISPRPAAGEGRPARWPASWAQQRLWFIDQLEGGSIAYHIPWVARLRGALNAKALQQALHALVQRHEALRTVFAEVDGELMQEILPEGAPVLRAFDLSACEEAEVQRHKELEAQEAFDLRTGPLIRGRLLRVTAEEHVLMLTMHHIVSDGWSMGILLRELAALYAAQLGGDGDPLEPLPIQYADYAHWQRESLRGEAFDEQLAYWRRRLEGSAPRLELPLDRARPAVWSYRGDNLVVALDTQLSAKLQAVAQRYGMTLFMVVYAAWAVLLSRLSGQRDVIIGTVVANRSRPELEGLIGFFVNTLALRIELDADRCVEELLGQVKELTLQAYAHQDIPFERLVEALQPQRSLNRNPLFQVMLAVQNAPAGAMQLPGLTVSPEHGVGHTSKFDLVLSLEEHGEQIAGGITYSTDLFDRETVERWMACFVVLLRSMAERPRTPIGELPILPDEERRKVVELFNATAAAYPHDRLIGELFEDQVRRTPDAIAVIGGTSSLTYAQLNVRANQLAHYLREQGVRAGEHVPIFMPRGLHMLVTQLALVKCGAVYVPLDVQVPAERCRFMIADCKARCVVVAGANGAEVSGFDGVRAIDLAEAGAAIAAQPVESLEAAGDAQQSLYVMYTSGSAGEPKGVVIPHRAVSRLVINNGYTQITPDDCIAHCSNPAFDASTFETWGALLNGARLVWVPQQVLLEPDRFSQMLRDAHVSVVFLTTAVFNQYAAAIPRALASLKYLLFGGELSDPKAVRRLLAVASPGHLLHVYGPTESTTFATWYRIESVAEDATCIPIGRPIANTQIYILDERGAPVPVGVRGEIYIGGAGVARGYLNREAQTAERFVRDRFGSDEQGRLYRTGDVGRWRADGAVEYLGRTDYQVKIRGFRIELEEIEAQLLKHAQVKEAVVVAREDEPGEKRLVAYYTRAGESEVTVQSLRDHLQGCLPPYMVPAAYVALESVPLSPNGKWDRRALPAPEGGAYRHREYEAPQGEREVTLARIWSELLRVQRVGRQDNFFELGGHSLLAVQVVSRVRTSLAAELSLRDLFEQPCVQGLAQRIQQRAGGDLSRIEAVGREGALPLSFAQQRMWFLGQLQESAIRAYHVPIALRLKGVLDRGALRAALDALVARHETLRTRFVMHDGVGVQEILPAQVGFALEDETLRGGTAEQLRELMREEAHETFELSRRPAVRGRLVELGDEEHVLLVTMHHIVTDGWSLNVLLKELGALYGAFHQGRGNELPPLSIQYADYAVWERKRLSGELLQRQARYWKEALSGAPELLELPTDHERPAVQEYAGDEVQVLLEEGLVRKLQALSQRHGTTLYMVVLAGWAVLLSRLSGQSEVVIGTPVVNRTHTELEGLIGFFANTLALRLDVSGNPGTGELLARVRHQVLQGQAHAELPFDQVVELVKPPRTLSHTPIFQVLLAWQNLLEVYRVELEGLQAELQVEPLGVLSGAVQFDLALSVGEVEGRIVGEASYASSLYERQTIQRHLECWRVLLEGMAADETCGVRDLPLLSAREREQVLREFNATGVEFERGKLLHELFEEQVERTPDGVAVEYEDQRLTYAQLNERANRLAHHLRERGVGPDARVAICAERSLEMVVGLLGVLKAGGAYVPLDPSYPAERLQYMLRDAAPQVLLTQGSVRERVSRTSAAVIVLDEQWSVIAEQPATNPPRQGLRPDHLVYVIYTSGSTGEPKGAMNEHRGVVNYLQWMQQRYELTDQDRVLQKTPFSFDVSVCEFFWPLLNGARLVVARPQGHQDPQYLRSVIEEKGVTRVLFVPSMLQSFLQSHAAGRCAGLRQIMCSGEELSGSLQRKCLESLPQARLSNLYGPAEASIEVMAWECRAEDGEARVPIGRPIANTQIYILDERGAPVPVGVRGEIYIGGVGVGRGYLNREAQTAERFVRDRFGSDEQGRLYRTGDVGRWRADGAVEYLGRTDHQVKIRGSRIELGEIEAQLLKHAQVKEAVVVAREDEPGEKRLVAYYTRVAGESEVTVESLREHLQGCLPQYMVPAAYVALESFPLSPNGKLDRRGLPAPEGNAYRHREYEPPQGESEAALAQIWSELLRVERVGRQDNFFELGGHSLLIVQILERLRAVGLTGQVRDVFESATLAGVASMLRREARATEVPPNRIPAGCERLTPEMLPLVQLTQPQLQWIEHQVPGGARNIQDIYPLAPLQEGILFHHLLGEGGGDTYVLPVVLSVSSKEQMQELIAALQAVVDRHDILRTAVLWEALQQPVQVVYRRAQLRVKEIALDHRREVQEQLKEWIQPHRQRVAVNQAPLMAVHVAADPHSEQWYVWLQLHHMTCDHEGLSLIFAEAQAHLEGRAQELPAAQPYRNHVAQALELARAQDAEAFFRRKLWDVEEATVPFGLEDVHGDGSEVEESQEPLSEQESRRVRRQARRQGVSAATLFHAAWALVVAGTSGREDVVFGTVLLGRLQGSPDGQRILGMFINTLPLRLRVAGCTAGELVQQTHRELTELLTQEQASLSVAQRCSGIGGGAPLFSALLNYRHGVPEPAAAEAGVSGVRFLASQERTNYPIMLSVSDLAGAGFVLTAQTDRRIDPKRLTQYMRVAMSSLLQALEQAPQTPAPALSILPESERHQLIESFNATAVEFERGKLLHELFEEQVERSADSVAVEHEGRRLTYTQLNERANRLAHHLRERGVGPDARVAICAERGLEMIAGLLGILKAGAAYVPLDPSYPAERLQYMLQDAAPQVLLTQGSVRERIPPTSAAVIVLDEEWGAIAEQPATNPPRQGLGPDPLAYVIYTSGSTGEPKGVMVEHASVVNLLRCMQRRLTMVPLDRLLAVTTLSFDIAALEIYLPLVSGAQLVLTSREVAADAGRLIEELDDREITVLQATPATWRMLISSGWRGRPTLRALCGGEALPTDLAGEIRNRTGALWNVYGPTETTIWSCAQEICAAESRGQATEAIGRPIDNTQLYILNSALQPLPIGAVGEIHIGGAGVARGYLNLQTFTAERFIANPFGRGRVYKTGDLGRWRGDGVIEYRGRSDQQLKIRGFRVEPGEIEARLRKHAAIGDAAVVAREPVPGDKRLVAYVTPRTGVAAEAVTGPAFSLFYFGADTYAPDNKYDLYLRSVKFADENGFEAVWTPERHFDQVGSLYPDPSVLSAAAAVVTRSVKLRAGSVVVPLDDVIRIAEKWAVVDNLSQGRVGLALASGWHTRDFVLQPDRYASRRQVTFESIAALQELWKGHAIMRKDGEGREASIRIFPRPVQAELPLWLTAAGSPETFIEAGRRGLNVLTHLLGQSIEELAAKITLYRSSLEAHGFDKDTGRVTVMIHAFLGDDFDQAVRQAREPFLEYLKAHVGLQRQLVQSLGYSLANMPEEDLDSVVSRSFERYVSNASLIGTAQSSLALVNRLHEIGVGEIACLIDWMSADAAMGGLAKLAGLRDRSRIPRPSAGTLAEYCAAALPEHLVPSSFVFLDELTLTPSGKVDRKALPAPEWTASSLAAYQPPQGDLEEALADIWQELLHVKQVGRHDNFFDLGGHSVLAVQLVARIQCAFEVQMPLARVFSAPTLAQLAEALFSLTLQQFSAEDVQRVTAELDQLSEREIRILAAHADTPGLAAP